MRGAGVTETGRGAWAPMRETDVRAAAVEAAAAWMTSPSSSKTGVQSAGRYLEQKSAFGGSNAAVPASVFNQQPGNVPQRFPVGAQTPLPVRQ